MSEENAVSVAALFAFASFFFWFAASTPAWHDVLPNPAGAPDLLNRLGALTGMLGACILAVWNAGRNHDARRIVRGVIRWPRVE